MTRREILIRAAAAGAGVVVASGLAMQTSAQAAPTSSTSAKRVLRFAHPTDIHVQPELRGAEGMAACFRHMVSLPDPPQLIITGGDLPMDSASTPHAKAKVQWDTFIKVLKNTVPPSTPVYHTLGNHDIFGRDKVKCAAKGDEAYYGRKWFLQNFGYERTYRSFDSSGWHFIILDSIDLLPDGDEFVARITGEQLEWFKSDLASTPATTPTVIISHVPFMSVANYFDRDDDEWDNSSPDLKVSTKRMHADCREIDALFRKYPNIKLCLSGHLHLLDRCEYNGVTHICDGAVCGAKWKGPKRQTVEGYGLIDLFDDGTFEHQYVPFGWSAAAP